MGHCCAVMGREVGDAKGIALDLYRRALALTPSTSAKQPQRLKDINVALNALFDHVQLGPNLLVAQKGTTDDRRSLPQTFLISKYGRVSIRLDDDDRQTFIASYDSEFFRPDPSCHHRRRWSPFQTTYFRTPRC